MEIEDTYKKCDICQTEAKHGPKTISNPKTLKKYSRITDYPISFLCGNCAQSLKKSKKTVRLGSAVFLKPILANAAKGVLPKNIEELLQDARAIRDKAEREIRKAIQHAQDSTIVLNFVNGAIFDIEYAYGAYLWNTYEERRKRSNYVISQNEIRTMVFHRDGFKCKLCESKNKLTVDHVKPVSKGGTDELDNLQTLCKSCNSKKGTKYND